MRIWIIETENGYNFCEKRSENAKKRLQKSPEVNQILEVTMKKSEYEKIPITEGSGDFFDSFSIREL